jgi:predicted ribonuclease YlaK
MVPDTNVHIHGRLVHEVEWPRELSADPRIAAKRVTIVLPLVILDELDRVKDEDQTFSRRAQSVLKAIDRLARGRDWLSPIQLRDRVWLQLVDEPLGHERRRGNDDEIVRQAVYFSQLNEGRLILLTRDRGMLVRAQTSGLTSMFLPEHLVRIERKQDE